MAINLCNGHSLRLIKSQTLIPYTFKLYTTTTKSKRSAGPVFLEHPLEVPIIAITDKENVDLIGPPDRLSNLRPIVRKKVANETILEQKLRCMQDATHEWNQQFWAEHNIKFIKLSKEFVKNKQKELGTEDALTAEQMSEFYKKFLDDNWKSHVTYNIAWYKRNFNILGLSLRACLPRSLHFTSSAERY